MDGIQYQTPDTNNNLHFEENSLPLSQQAADYLMYILSTYVLEEEYERVMLIEDCEKQRKTRFEMPVPSQ